MELKGKKVLVFGAGKSGIGAADLLNAVGACPVLYDGKADLDKESVLHKISGNYELPIYAGELPKEVQESLDLQLKTIDLCNALFCEVNPIPVKKAVELLGMCGGTLRMPLTEMEPQNVEKLKKAMEDYGVL